MGNWSVQPIRDETIDDTGVAHQQRLPLPWQLLRDAEEFEESDFAHPAELDFARILTFYRIRWAYEPTTFPLAYAADGKPSEMFTPDFYLPDHKLYIELTTMRQRLVTRKNRKLRRLRELYPSIQIKLLYRRDYDRLVNAYGLTEPEEAESQVDRILFTEEEIHLRIRELASDIAAAIPAPQVAVGHDLIPAVANEPLLLLAVDQGSVMFSDHLAQSLRENGVVIEQEYVLLTRHRSPFSDRRVRIGRAPDTDLTDRHVLVVADVVSTGLSLGYLIKWLAQRGARRVEICTLLDRQGARLIDVPVSFTGFEAPNELLVGFGLNLRRQYRDLPYIASVAVGAAAQTSPSHPILERRQP